MPSQLRYARAPITEAVIDLRLAFDNVGQKPPALEVLEMLGEAERAAYPVKRKVMTLQATLDADDANTTVTREPIGIVLRSADELQVVQFRRDGFTFSRLKPYDRWEPFRDEARRLWAAYRNAVFPAEVKRLAVRYVNRFDLPMESCEIKDYFRFYAEYPIELPQRMLDFLVRVTVPLDDISAAVNLIQALGPRDQLDVASVVLDLDIYREVDVPQSEEGVWNYFEILRRKKNELFESSLLPPARELIGP